MVFSAQLRSQNFGHQLSLACLREWAWYAGEEYEEVDLDDKAALVRPPAAGPFVIGPGSLLYADWVPAFAELESVLQQRPLSWFTGLVPEFVCSEERRAFLRRVLERSGPVVVRWRQEADWLRSQFGFSAAAVGADPALLAPCRALPPRDKRVLFALNAYQLETDSKRALVANLAAVAETLKQRGYELEFLAGEPWDREVGRRLLGDLPDDAMPLGLEERCEQVERASLLISERLHPLLYAGSQHVPFVALTYHSKVEHFVESFRQPDHAVETRNRLPSVEELTQHVTAALADADRLRAEIATQADAHREQVIDALTLLRSGAAATRPLRRPAKRRRGRSAPTIAHCLAVRNESRRICELLETTRPHVDEILVWDDASTDRTGKLAATHADHVFASDHPAYCCEHYFDALRQLARSEWVLVISPDTVPSPELLEALPDLAAAAAADAYTFEIWTRDPSGDTRDAPKVRMFRRSATRWWPVPHVGPEVEGAVVDTGLRLYHLRERTAEEERGASAKHLRVLRVVRRELRRVWHGESEYALGLRERCRRVLRVYYPDYNPRSSLVVYRAQESSTRTAERLRGELPEALGNAWRILDWEQAKETPSGNPLVEADAAVLLGAGPDDPIWREVRREAHRLFIPVVTLGCTPSESMGKVLRRLNRWAVRVPALSPLSR